MKDCINISDRAKRTIDFSDIGFECGCYFNPVGNFSLIPFNGIWLASFRRFAYHITTDIQDYVTQPELKLNDPHKQLFCLLDRNFNFIKQLECQQSSFWEDPKFNRRTPYLEDMRMMEWNGTIYGISSVFYQGEKSYARFGLEVQRIEIGHKGMNCCSHIDCFHHWNSIQHGIMGRYKNFMPIPDNPFKFVSGTWKNGTQLFDMTTGIFIGSGGIVDGEEGLFRGNAPLLKTDFGYMGITHMLDYDERRRKRYNNFLVEYNADLSIRRISKPFKLCASNIEFITTLIDDGDDLLIGDTIMDDTPLLFRFDKETLYKAIELK